MHLTPSTSTTELRSRFRSAFTLIEILLAISIATGLLVVALMFYRQATELRGQILKESERLATVRMVMDRVVGDLQQARAGSGAGQVFQGDATSLSFMTATLPIPSAGPGAGTIVGGADLVRISLSAVTALSGTNTAVIGFLRQEQSPESTASTESTGPDPRQLIRRPDLSFELTNRIAEPTTEWIRFVRFRYWNGTGWQTGWTNTTPPSGVEVVLGTDPQPDDADGSGDDYPYEQFRRVVYVPVGMSQAPAPAEGEMPGITPTP